MFTTESDILKSFFFMWAYVTCLTALGHYTLEFLHIVKCLNDYKWGLDW
jgi:hypothetical protein